MNVYCKLIGSFLLLTLVAAAPEAPPSMAEKTATLADQWKARFEAEKLHWIIAPPFVIAGNGTAEQLARYRDGTLLAAERALEATYFDKAPADPILVLLFESEGPYRRLSKQWLDYANVPHFGFYRPGDHVMVMNVSTGLGTLVHELTHALIAPDFPTVPSWFNEGLASLYEQSSFGPNTTIIGHENWRLPALQKAIKDNKLRSIKELADDPDFYGEPLRPLNYAQARYLMFYLQEKGLLVRYYKTFRDGIADDPTGLKSLEKVIAPQGVGDFEKQWRRWVLALRFE